MRKIVSGISELGASVGRPTTKTKTNKKANRTNGTFAFASTHEANPSAKSKEPFFANA